jgi:hypothetical protein
MHQIGIGLALLRQDLRIQRCLGWKMLEQQSFRDGGGCGDALGRRAGEAVTGKATLGGAENKLPPQVTGHAQGGVHFCE